MRWASEVINSSVTDSLPKIAQVSITGIARQGRVAWAEHTYADKERPGGGDDVDIDFRTRKNTR